jgi:hypothetical protein
VIAQVERPGTQLHTGWAHVPAPEIAKAYWKLPADAKFVDTLKCMVRTVLPLFCPSCLLKTDSPSLCSVNVRSSRTRRTTAT